MENDESDYFQVFIRELTDKKFQKVAVSWVSNQRKYPWDTSLFKVIDYLIISTRKKNNQIRSSYVA